jgi:hypothetical protein
VCGELLILGKSVIRHTHDRPDSDSSSGGDDPPLPRPRQAGFIGLGLALILFLSVVIVKVASQRPLDVYRVVSGIKKAPPKEARPIHLFGRTTVSNDAIDADSSFSVANRIAMGSREYGFFFYPAFRPLVRSDQRITKTPTGRRIPRVRFDNWLHLNGPILCGGTSYIINNIGWPDAEVSQADFKFIDIQRLIGAPVAVHVNELHIGNEQKWPIDVQRGFGRGLQVAGDAYQLASEDREKDRGESNNEIRPSLSRHTRDGGDDPFPNLSQFWRVVIAMVSTYLGAGLAAWGIYRGWGLFDSRRRGAWFGVNLCLLGTLIALLGQALAWPA